MPQTYGHLRIKHIYARLTFEFQVNPIPEPLEDRLSLPPGRFRKAAAAIDFQNSQRKLIVRSFPLLLIYAPDTVLTGWPLSPARQCWASQNDCPHRVV